MTAPDPRLDEIQARAEGLTDLCPEYLRQGVRHLQRNCDIYCNEAEENDEHDCRQPDRYDGDRMAAVLADIPFLLAELRKAHEALQRVEALHKREVIAVHEGYGEEAICTECGHRWPCDTRAAVAAAKGDERG